MPVKQADPTMMPNQLNPKMKAMMIHICFLNNGRAVSMNGYNVRITGDRPDYPPMDHPVSFSYNCGNTNAIASIDAVVDYGVDSAGLSAG